MMYRSDNEITDKTVKFECKIIRKRIQTINEISFKIKFSFKISIKFDLFQFREVNDVDRKKIMKEKA